jgi:hypothetical protein
MKLHSKTAKLAVICIGLWSLPASTRAQALAIPTVAQLPANAPPAVPAGMKVTCTQGPGNAAPSPTCPVLKWQGFTYWAFSYVDNRLAMGIVAYDSAGKAVAQWEKPGDRYVYAITVDAAHKSVTFAGQAGPKISMTWAELEVSPAPAAGDRCSPAIPNNAGAAAVCNPVCSASGLTFAGNWSCDNGAATACRSKGQGACVCGCRQSQAPETPRTDKK